MLLLIVLSVVLGIISFISWWNMFTSIKKLNIRGPIPLPIVGHAHLFAGSSTDFFNMIEKLVHKYRDMFLVYIFSQRYVMFCQPNYVEAIVSNTEYNTKGISYNYLHPWLGQGLLTSSGYRWRTHRKFLTPAFHFNILQNFLPVFCKNAKILNEKLTKLSTNENPFDLFPIIALAALDNVTESIMGVSVNAQEDSESEYVKAIENLSNLVSTRMRNPLVGAEVTFNLLPHKTRQDKALKILHGQTRKVIETRREELTRLNINTLSENSDIGIKNKQAFLDLLLLSEIDGQKIDDEKVREEVDTFMFEGHDTTTSGIVFALFCMSKHPEVQEKVLNEQRSILGDDINRDPTYSEVKDMKYLELVIKESLRLYPSVPLIERLITQDTTVLDVHLPRNTAVVIDILHLQRRADLYEDPLEFKPERFNNSDTKTFGWLSFSAGPRNCIGQKFAMMEMKVTLSAIVKKFHILPTDRDPELVAELILRSKNGVYIKLKPRN